MANEIGQTRRELKTEIDELTAERDGLQTQLTASQGRVGELEAAAVEAETAAAESVKTIAALNERIGALEAREGELQGQIATLTEERATAEANEAAAVNKFNGLANTVAQNPALAQAGLIDSGFRPDQASVDAEADELENQSATGGEKPKAEVDLTDDDQFMAAIEGKSPREVSKLWKQRSAALKGA